MVYAKRMNDLGTETAFEVLARARVLERQGKEIVHLEIGEPDFDTPQHVKESAVSALRGGYTHYTPANGILELREAIADNAARNRNIDVHPDEVVVTPGAKPIIFSASDWKGILLVSTKKPVQWIMWRTALRSGERWPRRAR